MNTGIPSVASNVPGPEPASPKPKPDPAAAQSVSTDSNPAPASNRAPSPVSSSSSVSVSENGSSKQAQKQDAGQKPTLQDVIKLSEKMNEEVQKIQRDLNFSVDDSQGKIVVKVIDRGTKEVIRQIPSEEMLNLSRSIEEVNSLLFDKIKA